MAFDNNELKQLKELFDAQESRLRSVITQDVQSMLNEQELKLRTFIQTEINEVKERLDRLFKTESEDVSAAYDEIEKLKKRLAKLERQVALLK